MKIKVSFVGLVIFLVGQMFVSSCPKKLGILFEKLPPDIQLLHAYLYRKAKAHFCDATTDEYHANSNIFAVALQFHFEGSSDEFYYLQPICLPPSSVSVFASRRSPFDGAWLEKELGMSIPAHTKSPFGRFFINQGARDSISVAKDPWQECHDALCSEGCKGPMFNPTDSEFNFLVFLHKKIGEIISIVREERKVTGITVHGFSTQDMCESCFHHISQATKQLPKEFKIPFDFYISSLFAYEHSNYDFSLGVPNVHWIPLRKLSEDGREIANNPFCVRTIKKGKKEILEQYPSCALRGGDEFVCCRKEGKCLFSVMSRGGEAVSDVKILEYDSKKKSEKYKKDAVADTSIRVQFTFRVCLHELGL